MKLRPYIHRPRAAVQTTYSPAQIAQAYNFPTGLAPGGVIAIIELGGGWIASDIQAFCQKFGIPAPTIVDVECDAKNAPGGEADGEVALDIEVAAGVYSYCTGAAAQVRMYWATDVAPAVAKIIADVNAGVKISGISISWGAAEDVWGADAAKAADAAIAQLAPLGIPFFAAAGDNDSGDGEAGLHVDFPASSPHVIGCGGTTKTAASETVWNNGPGEGTGGGYSSLFPVQAWQTGAPAGPGRMVPDVAANADPHTGYEIFCQGQWQVVGGTSAVAPLYAGLVAAIAQNLIPGNMPALVWGFPNSFVDVTQGGNGGYQAAVGPDPCTGLGVPIGTALVKVFEVTVPKPPTPTPDPIPQPEPNPTPSPQPSPEPQPGPGPGHHPGHGGHHPPHRGRHGKHGHHLAWSVLERMQGQIAAEIRVMLGEAQYAQSLFDEVQQLRRIEAMKKCAEESTGDADRHEAWMKMHLEAGWVYGEQFDTAKKTHPNLKPWDELPATTRSKARIFDIVSRAAQELEVALSDG